MIKKISFLQDGKRVFLSPNAVGKFKIPGVSHFFSARELVDHPVVRENDPTLTLTDGKKYRVFHASNSTMPLVYPSIVIENFDDMIRTKVSIKKKSIAEKLKKRKEETTAPMYPIIPPVVTKKGSKCKSGISLPFLNKKDEEEEEEDYDGYDIFGDYDW